LIRRVRSVLNAPFRSVFVAGFEAFVGILRMRKGPEDVPASVPLLTATLVGGVLLRLFLLLAIPAETYGSPMVIMALEFGISLLSMALMLHAAGHQERFLQTITAVFGCQLVMAPGLFAGRWLQVTYGEQPGMELPSMLLSAVIAVWLLVAMVRILRSATQWPVVSCVFAIFAVEVLTVLAVISIYPPPPAAVTPA
jgi:hypothetical protein